MKPGILAVALVPCSYLAAQGTGHLLAASRATLDPSLLAPPAVAVRPAARPDYHVRDRAVILRRNVFDSSAGSLPRSYGSEPITPSERAPTEATGPCPGPARVLGGAIGSTPAWSFALVRSDPSGETTAVRTGQTLGGKVVRAVRWSPYRGTLLELESPETGARCYLTERVEATAPPPPPQRREPTAPPAGEATGIVRVGPRAVAVERGLVERVLSDPRGLMATTRVMPCFDGGRLSGLRVLGVAPDALLGRLGLSNGDVIESINGLSIATPDGALEALTRLRTADHLRIALRRSGAPMTLDVDVR